MKIAQIQSHVYPTTAENLEALSQVLNRLRPEKCDVVTLGEMFTCPYSTELFPSFAEKELGETWTALSKFAKEFGIILFAGSVPELDDHGRIYNTAYAFDRDGRQIAKHRKMHLFDIDVGNGQKFKESEVLSPGNECTLANTEFGKIGLCICFDFRFPELARLMVQKGAKMIVVPAAFNMTTGPAHWEIMFRSRAVDNQCFVAGTSVARNKAEGYVAWGHSLLVSPWGDVIQEMDEKPGYIVNDIDLEYADRIRRELPLLSARRRDLYILEEIDKGRTHK